MILTDQNFEQEIKNANKPILVDFFAEWCNPCKVIGPMLEKIAQEYQGKISFAKANIDTARLSAQKYGIDQIPRLILFKDAKPISSFVGLRPEQEIKQWLDQNLKHET